MVTESSAINSWRASDSPASPAPTMTTSTSYGLVFCMHPSLAVVGQLVVSGPVVDRSPYLQRALQHLLMLPGMLYQHTLLERRFRNTELAFRQSAGHGVRHPDVGRHRIKAGRAHWQPLGHGNDRIEQSRRHPECKDVGKLHAPSDWIDIDARDSIGTVDDERQMRANLAVCHEREGD